MQASASAQAELREQLLAIAEAYVHFARVSPARFRLMFGPLLATRAQHPAWIRRPPALRCCWAPPSGSTPGLLPPPSRVEPRPWPSHLLLDEAFAGLKVALPEPELLVRQLSALVLAGR